MQDAVNAERNGTFAESQTYLFSILQAKRFLRIAIVDSVAAGAQRNIIESIYS